MLAAVCAVVWASVCIPVPYDRVAALESIFRPAHYHDPRARDVRRLGVRLTAYQPDNFFDQDPNGLSALCEDRVCVRYRKRCDPSGRICSYRWGVFRPTANGSGAGFWSEAIDIHASSRRARLRAEAKLLMQIDPGDGTSTRQWPLSRLTALSATSEIAACPIAMTPGCPESDIRRLRRERMDGHH